MTRIEPMTREERLFRYIASIRDVAVIMNGIYSSLYGYNRELADIVCMLRRYAVLTEDEFYSDTV